MNNWVDVDAAQIVDSSAACDDVKDAASGRAEFLSQLVLTVLDDVWCSWRL